MRRPSPTLPTYGCTLQAASSFDGAALAHKAGELLDKVVDGLLRESQSFRTEVIPEKIESLLDSPRAVLSGCFLNQSEHIGRGTVIPQWSASPAERLLNTERNLC